MSENENNTVDEFTTSAELRAFVDNELSDDNNDVHRHMALVPSHSKDKLELMNFFASAYDPSLHPEAPHLFGNTNVGSKLRKNLATQVGNQAVKDGNISQMKYITGKQDYGYDASSIHALRKLRNRMQKDAYIAYVYGHMGHGKSDFCFLLGELAKAELGYKVCSNVRSPYEEGHTDNYIYTFGELLKTYAGGEEIDEIQDIQRLDIDVDEDERILFIFDEGNQEASGYSDDAYDAQSKLGKMVTLIRKVGGMLIIVGHTGKDVHPHIRRLTNDCIHKVSKKKCEFYHTVENGKGVGHKETIKGIPQTNWYYDTLEISFWDWSLSTQDNIEEVKEQALANNSAERNMAIFQDYHNGDEKHSADEMTQEVLADKYDLTKGRISQILAEMRERVESYKTAKGEV